MLCSVVGDDSDDRIRICLLCNFDVDSDDDEADVQKSDDDEASIEKSDDDEAAIEISDEEVDIESCDEEYVERVPDPRVWTKVQIRGKEGAVKWGNKFTKKMLSFLPEEEYGMKYSDEIIKEWTKELKGTGQSKGIESFMFKKAKEMKQKKKQEQSTEESEEDSNHVVFDMESAETTSEKISERIADENTQALDEEENSGVVDIETVKAVDIHFTSKDKRFQKKADLVKECERLGIVCIKENQPDSYLNANDIWENVEVFFSKLHKRDGTNAHSANCYIKERQKIDRTRKPTTAMKRAAALDHAKKSKKDRNRKRKRIINEKKKKHITPQEAIDMFPDSHGLFIAEHDTLRCHCTNKLGECQNLLSLIIDINNLITLTHNPSQLHLLIY